MLCGNAGCIILGLVLSSSLEAVAEVSVPLLHHLDPEDLVLEPQEEHGLRLEDSESQQPRGLVEFFEDVARRLCAWLNIFK